MNLKKQYEKMTLEDFITIKNYGVLGVLVCFFLAVSVPETYRMFLIVPLIILCLITVWSKLECELMKQDDEDEEP